MRMRGQKGEVDEGMGKGKSLGDDFATRGEVAVFELQTAKC